MSDEKTTGLFKDYIIDINVNCNANVCCLKVFSCTSSLLEVPLP
jgi:hypothetical protein